MCIREVRQTLCGDVGVRDIKRYSVFLTLSPTTTEHPREIPRLEREGEGGRERRGRERERGGERGRGGREGEREGERGRESVCFDINMYADSGIL